MSVRVSRDASFQLHKGAKKKQNSQTALSEEGGDNSYVSISLDPTETK